MDEGMFVPASEVIGESSRDTDPVELERTSRHAICAMRFDLRWQSENARHTDSQVSQKLNLWRDIFPPELESGVLDQPVGHMTAHHYPAGGLIESYRHRDSLTIKSNHFNHTFRKGSFIEPRIGRFYPKGVIATVGGIFPEDATPFRVTQSGEGIGVDLNHPLAAREMNLSAAILNIRQAGEEHGGVCHDIAEMATIGGPGMQARWDDQPTDFWSDDPFVRLSNEADAFFYQMPRMVDHIDRAASSQIERLYGRLIPQGGEVLDLMSSWNSHLPEDLKLSHLSGLGLNREELDANPRLQERLVHDLNLKPVLPYEDNRFDAIVCNLSVEYLVKPIEIFTEALRVLKPGGRLILTFSNRWFQPKVVKIWQDLHEFERMGLVLEYFLLAGGFTNLETWSMRGLLRPLDDKYAKQMPFADPLYAVWGEKAQQAE